MAPSAASALFRRLATCCEPQGSRPPPLKFLDLPGGSDTGRGAEGSIAAEGSGASSTASPSFASGGGSGSSDQASVASASAPTSPKGSVPPSIAVLPMQDALAFFLNAQDIGRLLAACGALREELSVLVVDGCVARRFLVLPALEVRMQRADVQLAMTSLPHVRVLRISNRLSLNSVAAAVGGGHRSLCSLEKLVCNGTGLYAMDVAELLEPMLAATKEVKILSLERNRLGDDAVKALSRSEVLGKLKTLNIRFNNIGEEGAEALAASPWSRTLTVINLKQNRIGDAGAVAFASMLHGDTCKLRLLNLRRQCPPLTDRAALALAEMLRTNRGIEQLRLRRNRITDKGAVAFAEAAVGRLAQLCKESLWEAPRLELDLEENQIGDVGALALLRLAAATPRRVCLEVLLFDNIATRDSLAVAALPMQELAECLDPMDSRLAFVSKGEFAL